MQQGRQVGAARREAHRASCDGTSSTHLDLVLLDLEALLEPFELRGEVQELLVARHRVWHHLESADNVAQPTWQVRSCLSLRRYVTTGWTLHEKAALPMQCVLHGRQCRAAVAAVGVHDAVHGCKLATKLKRCLLKFKTATPCSNARIWLSWASVGR